MNKKTFLLAGALASLALFGALQAADTKEYPGTALEPSGNPIFTDAWTCDPAPLVVGDRLFVYTGEDIYKDGEQNGLPGNYNIAAWRCYSTTDMVHWTSHGVLLKPEQFPNGRAGVAWAAQVVEKGGKFRLTMNDLWTRAKRSSGSCSRMRFILISTTNGVAAPCRKILRYSPIPSM